MLPGTLVPSLDEVSSDIDAQGIRSGLRGRYRRGAITTAEIQDLLSSHVSPKHRF
jgi:hypothetical protein